MLFNESSAVLKDSEISVAALSCAAIENYLRIGINPKLSEAFDPT
jgi:hypothetical protein